MSFLNSKTSASMTNNRGKKIYNYRKKNGDLWSPPKGWLKFYRCQACNVVMSKKDQTKCPQKITCCGHITCANCIVTSYLILHNPLCPVKGCKECVNPKQDEKDRRELDDESDRDEHDRDEYENGGYESNNAHYCGSKQCRQDCGVLRCGCVDVCRGRCGTRDSDCLW